MSRAVVAKATPSSPGALRLVSYIEGPHWQRGTQQVPPGYLDCPAVDACYVLAQTVLTTVGPYPNYYNAVYFSGDGGGSWSSLDLPPGLEFTTPLSCPSAQTCVGAAYQGEKNRACLDHRRGPPVAHQPAAGPGRCAVPQLCLGLGLQPGYWEQLPGPGHPDQFAATTDGGASWSVHNFGSDVDITSFTCPSARDCIVIAGPQQGSGRARR